MSTQVDPDSALREWSQRQATKQAVHAATYALQTLHNAIGENEADARQAKLNAVRRAAVLCLMELKRAGESLHETAEREVTTECLVAGFGVQKRGAEIAGESLRAFHYKVHKWGLLEKRPKKGSTKSTGMTNVETLTRLSLP